MTQLVEQKRRVRIETGECYHPFTQDKITDRLVFIESKRGCGKTRAALTLIVARAMRYPGSRWLLARSDRIRLAETVQETLEEQVLPLFEIPFSKINRSHRTHYDVPGGGKLLLAGLNDIQRSQSLEIAGGYVAEATELKHESDLTSLVGALRQQCGVPYFQIIADANPTYPMHWLNRMAMPADDSLRKIRSREDYDRLQRYNQLPTAEGKIKRIIATPYDNPGYFDSGKWEWTQQGKDYYDGLGLHLSGHIRSNWLDGLWVAPSGTVFGNDFTDAHILAPRAAEWPRTWPVYVFVDPGYDHPCAVLWIGVLPDDSLIVLDEIHESGRSVAEIAEMIHNKNHQFGNIKGYYADPQGAKARTMAGAGLSIITQFKNEGLYFSAWPATGSNAQAMVEAIRTSLRQRKIFVCSNCVGLIENFQTFSYKRSASGELPKGDDAYVDANNDALDALKGAVALKLKHKTQTGQVIDRRPLPTSQSESASELLRIQTAMAGYNGTMEPKPKARVYQR